MGIEPPSPHIQVDTSRQVDKSTSRQVDNVDNDRQGTHVVTINLESTTSTMVDKELTTHRQLTVDNWSTMVDKVDKLSTRSTRSTNRAQVLLFLRQLPTKRNGRLGRAPTLIPSRT